MAKYRVLSGQSLFDLSLRLYGDASKVVKLLGDNPQFTSANDYISAGTVVNFDESQSEIVNFFIERQRDPATAPTDNQLGKGFNSGFKINSFK